MTLINIRFSDIGLNPANGSVVFQPLFTATTEGDIVVPDPVTVAVTGQAYAVLLPSDFTGSPYRCRVRDANGVNLLTDNIWVPNTSEVSLASLLQSLPSEPDQLGTAIANLAIRLADDPDFIESVADLVSLPGSPGSGVTSFNGRSGAVLPNVNDYSGFYLATGLAGQPNGLATLGSDGKVPSSQLPVISGGTTYTFSSPLALSGTTVSLPLATGSSDGAMSSANFSKLAGIATGATANQTDTFLLNRANHTGTQAISTVTGLQSALDAKESSGAATTAINNHTAASNPHSQYALSSSLSNYVLTTTLNSTLTNYALTTALNTAIAGRQPINDLLSDISGLTGEGYLQKVGSDIILSNPEGSTPAWVNAITYSQTAPVSVADNDVWIELDASDRIIHRWQWDGVNSRWISETPISVSVVNTSSADSSGNITTPMVPNSQGILLEWAEIAVSSQTVGSSTNRVVYRPRYSDATRTFVNIDAQFWDTQNFVAATNTVYRPARIVYSNVTLLNSQFTNLAWDADHFGTTNNVRFNMTITYRAIRNTP